MLGQRKSLTGRDLRMITIQSLPACCKMSMDCPGEVSKQGFCRPSGLLVEAEASLRQFVLREVQGPETSPVKAAGAIGGGVLDVVLVEEGVSAVQHHIQDAAQAPVVHLCPMGHAIPEHLWSCRHQCVLGAGDKFPLERQLVPAQSLQRGCSAHCNRLEVPSRAQPVKININMRLASRYGKILCSQGLRRDLELGLTIRAAGYEA